MKRRLLDILRCPFCGAPFRLKVRKLAKGSSLPRVQRLCTHSCTRIPEPGPASLPDCSLCCSEDVLEGALACTCVEFPIQNSLARILKGGGVRGGISKEEEACLPFELQWRWWEGEERLFGKTNVQMEANTVNERIGSRIDGSFYKGKVVLDAGFGHGRYLAIFRKLGAEVVGIEITKAAENILPWAAKDPFVHPIQGDLSLGFLRDEVFDLVFCDGVLHHIPDPARAFHLLARSVKKGGGFYVWVYPKGSWLWERSQSFLRKITTRLPHSILRRLAYLAVPLLSLVPSYSGTSLRNSSWRQCVQVIWDYYAPCVQSHHTPEEVREWFLKEGFEEPEVLPVPLGMIGFKR